MNNVNHKSNVFSDILLEDNQNKQYKLFHYI